MFKKTLIVILSIFLVTVNAAGAALATVNVTGDASEDVSAASALLLDSGSGRVLYAKNEGVRRPMASTTKIMTAIVALEEGNLEDIATVSPRAAVVEGSSIWLEAGEKKTLEELVYGLMLCSGNDAAVAIAEHISGSVEKFAQLMTSRCQELGAYNTRFRNPHGLDEEGHYTTAYDLAIITRHAMTIPKFKEIICTEEKSISWPGHEWDRLLRNQNRLLEVYPGGDGVKTGWTTPAGRCFVGSATRDNSQLIAVVLNAPNMWEDAMFLLDYGFNNYEFVRLFEKNAYLKKVPAAGGDIDMIKVMTGNAYVLPLKDEEKERVSFLFEMKIPVRAPVARGTLLGNLNIYVDNELVGNLPLVAAEEVGKRNIFTRFGCLFL